MRVVFGRKREMPGGRVSDLALSLAATPVAAVADCDEYALIQRARSGNMDAFEEIMVRYESRILRFITGAVGDAEVAQELCQETFLAAYRALPRTDPDLKLSAWLHTIAINRARSHHRRRKLRQFVPLLDEHVSNSPDLQQSVATDDTVQRALARMPLNYREPLLLQLAGGLSCREIAEVLGASEGAIKVRLMRAREAFRTAYEDEDRQP
jgi:RNA polymerase sigma-70 factor, ECF subfamily